MSAKVHLKISQGKDAGKVFSFTEHDTFIFGRMADCHACIPHDTQVSRHHFILEVNPPAACLRDLGSLNGTYVNGRKCGAREKGESVEEGAKRRYPEVTLKHGDRIKVGETEFCRWGQRVRLMFKNHGDLSLSEFRSPRIIGSRIRMKPTGGSAADAWRHLTPKAFRHIAQGCRCGYPGMTYNDPATPKGG